MPTRFPAATEAINAHNIRRRARRSRCRLIEGDLRLGPARCIESSPFGLRNQTEPNPRMLPKRRDVFVGASGLVG